MEEEEEHAEEEGVATDFNEIRAVRALEEAFTLYSVVKRAVLLYDIVLGVWI